MILIVDNTQVTFWTSHGDFWVSGILAIIGIIASIFGLIYSRKASREAELAKDAANRAGVVVKTQEIVMELERISNSCQLEEAIIFQKAMSIFNDISARVYGILGMYKADQEIVEEIKKIEEHLYAIKTAIDTANRSNPSSPLNDSTISNNILENYVYNITAPHFTNLIGSLNKLKGILNNRLIKST